MKEQLIPFIERSNSTDHYKAETSLVMKHLILMVYLAEALVGVGTSLSNDSAIAGIKADQVPDVYLPEEERQRAAAILPAAIVSIVLPLAKGAGVIAKGAPAIKKGFKVFLKHANDALDLVRNVFQEISDFFADFFTNDG
ncbi:unnamed protein product [Cylicocyclus nassatus]|uniref:Uncharacterized protein n=1 Tax=Cylicocyclus nassatus TaxID=53992 RepID=A0AA36GCJ6_CYLNA|nr:unnamed protein product [Cylicocyclus nassatus]